MSFSQTHLSARESTASERTSLSFAFAGIAFQVRLDAAGAQAWQLPETYRATMHTTAPARCMASARCDLSLDTRLAGTRWPEGHAHWQRRADVLLVRADELELEIQLGAPAHYEVAMRIGAPAALARAWVHLAATLLELSGGLCLHATAVELAGRAVLLLGPSGTGKTTAAQLLGSAPCFANDRVALVPEATGSYTVWPMPVGNPPALARSQAAVLPLGALLRVMRAAHSTVRPMPSGRAVLYIREAIEAGVDGGSHELARLEAASALASAAVSGIAEIALSEPWLPALERFLRVGTLPGASA